MRNTKLVNVGGCLVGGGERIKIQSMTTTKTADVERTVAQILALEKAGCDIVRVAVADEADAVAIKGVKEKIGLPLVADIHFSAKLAVTAIENGADKVRINPGNIGGEKEIKLVADCLKRHNVPVRVGSNTGSIERNFLAEYGRSARALVESALFNVSALEKLTKSGFHIYNLGTGKGYSVLEVIKAFEKACGFSLKYKIMPRRAGDIATSFADPKKANLDLGWKANLNIDDMCSSLWNWQLKNPDGYR